MESSTFSKSPLFLLLATLLFSLSAYASPTSFLLSSCKATTYPTLCIQSLSAYVPLGHRSPRQLAQAALTVSATRAHEVSTYIARLSSSASGHSVHPSNRSPSYGVQDCLQNMNDSADRLQRSIIEFGRLGRIGRRPFVRHLTNVQTWVSSALTDLNMCLVSLLEDEGGPGSDAGSRSLHLALRKKVMEVNKVTSNALALVNWLGSRN